MPTVQQQLIPMTRQKSIRLSSKVTTIIGGSRAQDLAYTYDANAISLASSIIPNQFQENSRLYLRLFKSFAHRLLSPAPPMANNYAETYAYDAMRKISQVRMANPILSGTGKTNPHAVTSIGAASYTYDDNGNLLTDGNLTNTWIMIIIINRLLIINRKL